MFEEYKRSLLDFYRIKKENNLLTTNLEIPGRDKLKKECVEVFLRKNTQKDKDLVKSIFDPTNKYEDQVRSIEKFKVDKLRPLVNFLTEGTSIREEKFVKLLGWLLDFTAYDEWRQLSDEDKKRIFEKLLNGGKTPPVSIGPPTTTTDPPKPPREETTYRPRFSTSQIIISCIILLFITSTSFIAWERMAASVRTPNADEKHMYWNGDHYEPVKNGTHEPGVTIIPLDLKLLQQQRKITLPDTLTKYSLGKVWYKGHGNDHEFFTDSGAYPSDTNRVLKPLSNMILTKYTSNYKYMLTRLVWLLCAAFLISTGGYLVSRMKRKIILKKDPQVAEENTDDLIGAELAQ
ncbi:hypothetical protein ASE74_00265 [Pedobacter sp. Leaf216]|uniref:hypothetical protein n=1 Tax=Pedobacter sp. Leaf216 TaxID=1735684 RepID=UPI0006FD17A2|nr:hypothetical protein [Pedobacter sp. Leaf216]KQM79052.1 hypothetical protein ASE74_00265 [Pedobacter sp. Leaf216]